MKSNLIYIINFILCFLPDTRCFALKRSLYRFAGVKSGEQCTYLFISKILGNGCLTIGDNTWIGHKTLIISSSSIIIGSNVIRTKGIYWHRNTRDRYGYSRYRR
jgi:acetyltransferase-like isoleucine patch superfamily enzyme